MRLLCILLLSFGLGLGGISRVLATSDEYYGPDQYRTINHGQSPDGKYAIAAHDDTATNDFHLYLMDASTGKKIGVLEEINDTFETASYAYDAR